MPTLAAIIRMVPCERHAADNLYLAGQNQKYRDRLADRLKATRDAEKAD